MSNKTLQAVFLTETEKKAIEQNVDARKEYVEGLVIGLWHEMTLDEIGTAIGVSGATIGYWNRKVVDWPTILHRARNHIAQTSYKVDRALVSAAIKEKVPAIELYYEKFEGWVPSSKVISSMGGVDDSEIDAELKELLSTKEANKGV